MKEKVRIGNKRVEINLPEDCPYCQRAIVPKEINSFRVPIQGSESFVYIALQCPSCKETFFAKYYCEVDDSDLSVLSLYNPYSDGYYFQEIIGGSEIKQKFSDEVEKLSPRFVSIFRQADAAMQKGWNDVAGIGFRYSFEILVKDYLISLREQNIPEINLGECIAKLNPDIFDKELFRDTVWLGNDFAHYVSKHPEMDIHELRDAIMSCVEKIDRHIKDQNLKKKLCPDKQS